MAHKLQEEFVQKILAPFEGYFSDKFILEFGSFTVNRSVREFFPNPRKYIGVDIANGPGVDVLSKAHEYKTDEMPDIVISCEMLEHDLYAMMSFSTMIYILKPGGMIIMTCGYTGRAEHGTPEHDPVASPGNRRVKEFIGHYQNVSLEDISGVLMGGEIFETFGIEINNKHHDIYFWGIKNA